MTHNIQQLQFESPSNQKRVRAVTVHNFKVMCQPHSTFEWMKMQLARRGLKVHETAHFLFTPAPIDGKTILVHRFTLEELDNNIGYYLMQELAPQGLITSDQAFGAALIGVVVSTFLDDPVTAWNRFSLNTLQRLREHLDDPPSSALQNDFITSFAYIYHRLFVLKVGSSLLDVGCACAFWPILVAERANGTYQRIVGVDNRADAIALSNNLAASVNMTHLEFIQDDLLAPAFTNVGTFDTVTAIALLEHLPEEQLPRALEHLLQVTRRRLLIAVPYEEQATLAFGHRQVFTPEKLDYWGRWCVAHLQGNARYRCEEVMGGLLVIERNIHV